MNFASSPVLDQIDEAAPGIRTRGCADERGDRLDRRVRVRDARRRFNDAFAGYSCGI